MHEFQLATHDEQYRKVYLSSQAGKAVDTVETDRSFDRHLSGKLLALLGSYLFCKHYLCAQKCGSFFVSSYMDQILAKKLL